MMTAELLGPLNAEAPPEVSRQMAERNELRRIAAASALRWMQGCDAVDAHALAYARHWASIKPLGEPLSDGAP